MRIEYRLSYTSEVAMLLRMQVGLIVGMLMGLLSPTCLFAQDLVFERSVSITSIGSEEDSYQEVREEVKEALRSNLVLAGLDVRRGQLELLVDVYELRREGPHEVVISATVLSHVPEALVTLGGEHEVFYAVMGDQSELPEEGKMVRQHMSAEYVRQFRMVIDSKIVVALKSPVAIDQAAAEIVNWLVQRYFSFEDLDQ